MRTKRPLPAMAMGFSLAVGEKYIPPDNVHSMYDYSYVYL